MVATVGPELSEKQEDRGWANTQALDLDSGPGQHWLSHFETKYLSWLKITLENLGVRLVPKTGQEAMTLDCPILPSPCMDDTERGHSS